LNDQTFKDLSELKIFTYSILQKYPINCSVSNCDKTFLVSLFNHHPNASSKLPGLTQISVGLHQKGERDTKCFIIEKETEKFDISYIKAINGFVSFRQTVAETESLNKFQENVNKVIEFLIRVLRDNPLLIGFCKENLTKIAPHKSAEVKFLKFYTKNLLAIAEKIPGVLEFAIKICLEKLIEVEGDGDKDKFDQLACVFLCFLHKNYSSNVFKSVLAVFESHILSTSQTVYVHYIVLNLCEKTVTNSELFLSVLIKSIFRQHYTLASASYIASFLLIHSNHAKICVKYLIYYSLKHHKTASRASSVKQVLKYVIFLYCYKPELQQDKQMENKLKILLKNTDYLKGLPLQEGLDYSELLRISNFSGDLCLTNLYLPFHTELPEFKLCSVYFQQIPLFFKEKKRKRCMSIDIPSTLQIRKRAFSIDESKLHDRVDTASITTTGSNKYLAYE